MDDGAECGKVGGLKMILVLSFEGNSHIHFGWILVDVGQQQRNGVTQGWGLGDE